MVLKHKVVQTIIAMLTEDKVTEIFYMADEFCKFFWSYDEEIYHRGVPSRWYLRLEGAFEGGVVLIMILFHDSGYRCLDTAIDGVPASNTSNASKGIYNLNGLRMDVKSREELPAGLYILNGKKIVVK